MNFIETFGPHLPYLRRFSRALTGSQENGDFYVRLALEALENVSKEDLEKLPAKATLYKMLLGIWKSSGAALEADQSEQGPIRVTPLPRQAFLLYAMEGMLTDEIAQILAVDQDEAKSLIAEAEAQIEEELRTNVMIIEDEAFIAADIEGLVMELGHSVDAIVATHATAVEAANKKTPGLILADVQLADGSSGIEAVSEIIESKSIPVIFITAFPERLLTGERPEPAYLISKPFEPSNVKAAISQALYFHQDV